MLCVMATFQVLVNALKIFSQRQTCTALVLSAGCTEGSYSPNIASNF